MTTDPKREALAAEVKRLAENYAVLDTKAARKALHAAIDALTAPSAGHGEGRAEMVWCGCGDGYPENSYEAGFMAAAGKCVNCDAADAPSAGHGEGWVSVEDDLPEKNTEVLIFFEGVSALPSTGQYTASVHDHDGWCYPRENFDDASGEWPKVTHWQHLPASPTPKDNRHE